MMRKRLSWLHRHAPILNKNPAQTNPPRRRSLSLESLESRELLAVDVTPVYHLDNSWTSGFQGEIRLDNHDGAILKNWTLEFDMAAKITSIWNAKVVSQSGNHYTIAGAAWDADLPGSGSVSFGFVANATAPAAPSNYVINGGSIVTPPPPPALPKLSISDVSIGEGNSGTANAVFTVSLSAASTSAVSVAYATAAGTATTGTDFTATSGTVSFAPGQTTRTVTVSVRGDTTVESNETFFVNLVSASGATIADSQAVGTIANDDTAPPTPGGNFTFQVTSDWGSGFNGDIAIRNSGSAAVTDWQLTFDFAGSISSIWNAQIVSHTGNHYVVKNAGYNSTIAAGATTSFGFTASRANTSVVPTNFTLSGGSGPVTPPPTANRPPQAVADAAFTNPAQAVVIHVLANDTDADGDALNVTAITQPAHGAVVLNADSTVRYTPTAGFTGNDAFTYTLRDAAGNTATGNVSVSVVVPGQWPAHVYAPYIDMTLYPIYDFVSAAQTSGVRFFTLAFVVADSQNRPAWGGFSEYGLGTAYDTQLRSQISQLRAMGGDVIVSFGGAANRELAEVITSATALQAAYQSIIDAYGLTHIDFDIEGGAVADRASVDRRNVAIAGLQRVAAAAGRELVVSYTLPVLPTGLTADGVYVVSSAISRGVNVGLVNVMAMDYGDSAAPNPNGRMGDYAIQAATNLYNQLAGLYGSSKTESQLWSMIGVTPMIGLNDVVSETFDQQEARELVAFAKLKGIGRVAMWSLNRDQQNAAGKLNYVDLKSSSILQSPFEFSQIFNTVTG